jgi:hypothetical protein
MDSASFKIRADREALHVTPPRISILSLPRELRDRIYGFSLISPSPITVWAARVRYGRSSNPAELARSRIGLSTSRNIKAELNVKTDLPSLRDLGLSLLRCCRAIAAEASFTFYQSNTFNFLGRHNWNPIVDWLEQIGPRNSEYLANLRAWAPTPVYVWQDRDGTREWLDPDGDESLAICEPIYPRHVRFARPSGANSEGLTQNINPAIDRLFSLLSHNNGKKLTITLDLSYNYIPGVIKMQINWMPSPDLDLPNFVEAVRADHASKDNSRLIDVTWKGCVGRERFASARTKLEESGWDIREEPTEKRAKMFSVDLDADSSEPGLTVSTSTASCPNFDSHFLLRRKGLTGPLIAEVPFLRSRLYSY